MTDQQLANLLFFVVVALPPAVGSLFGLRGDRPRSAFMTTWLVTAIVGLAVGVAWAAVIDAWAAANPEGGASPFGGPVAGINAASCVMGGAIGAAIATFTGVVAAVFVARSKRGAKRPAP